MNDHPEPPDPDAAKPGPEDSTRRDSEAMLGGKPPQDPLIGTKVDQYSIKRVIGEGGMGVVYEALQQSPRRTVALKMMKRGVTSKSAMRRFEYEAQTLGRLRHDGIAQIYQAGTWDDGTGGRPWFAMEYIQGAKSLTRYCKDKKLGTRERLDIFSKVCAAVQHGHAKGIIHRDLKPGNILVTSSGVPKVIDFGVARSTDSDMAVTTLQTDVGALIGTLQYMSPEQCDADPNDIDTRSDVYALGVVLYELLCDQLPYALRHAAIHEAARIIREEEPTKPSSLDKRLRGDIETITLKALEKDRDRRYQSATALEEDIDRYLAGDPIAAKAPSAIDYLKRFARKHKAAAASIAVVFIVLVGAVIAISSIAVELSAQRNTAESAVDKAEQLAKSEAKHRKIAQEQAHEAEQAQQHVLLAAYQGNIHAAAEALSNNSLYDVRRKLADAERMVEIQQLKAGRAGPSNGFVLEGIPQDQLPFEWQYLHARADDAIVTLRGHEHLVDTVTFSPDGQRLASGSRDATIRLWDASSGEELSVLRGYGGSEVAFSPDGTRLASGGGDNTVRLWDSGSGEELAVLRGHEKPVLSVTFSPDGKRLASGSDDATIRLWDASSGEELSVLRGHSDLVSSVAFSLDGQRLASGSGDATIRLWDVATGEELSVLYGHEEWVHSVTFSPDGERLASGSRDATIRLWDASSGEELAVLRGHERWVESITFSPDGQQLASGSDDATIRLWDASSGEELAVLRGHSDLVSSVTFSPDGQRLASGSRDATIRLWDASSGEELAVLRGHERSVESITFSPDGQQLASGSDDNTIRLWDASSSEEFAVLRGHERSVESVTFSPDGERLASAGDDKAIRLWDMTSGEELAVLHGHEKTVLSVTFSPDGQRLASRSDDKTIRLWDMTSGEELAVLHGHAANNRYGLKLRSVTFSPDGERLASGSSDNDIQIWDMTSGEELAVLRGHSDLVSTVAFSPDGQLLASGSRDTTIRLWDASSGEELSVLRGHSDLVSSVTFSPDGQLLASGSRDATIRLWDGSTGEGLSVLRGPGDSVWSVTFSPDGKRLASGSSDNDIQIWDASSGEELAALRGHEGNINSVVFSPDGRRLASGGRDGTVRLWETRSRGQIAQDRRLSQEEMLRLAPLVETWIEKSGGDTEVLLAILERENKNRSSREQATLRNIVLKSSQTQRDVNDFRRRIAAASDETKTALDRAYILNATAWNAATSEDPAFFAAVSDDVLVASQRSCELTDYENAMYLDTLARVHFERGELAEALKWQELAMQHIPEGDEKGAYQRSLDRYLGAAQLDVATPAEP